MMISATGKTGMNFRGGRGFTLVEILLVVLLLGIVAGFAFPDLSQSYARFQLNQEADHLAYLMRYAQSRAIIQQQEHRLAMNPGEGTYRLTHRAADFKDEDSEMPFQRITKRLGRTFHIPEELSLETDNETVGFYPDGKMDKVRVTLCRKEKCLIVSTGEISGYVHVFKED